MEIKKVLVTGSDGYIGSVLCSELLRQKYEVYGLDTLFYKKDIFTDNKEKDKLFRLDTRKIDDLDLKGFDAIIHLAALSNDPIGQLNAKLTEDINFKATIELAKKAKKQGVKRFLFSSSCSIYGIAKKLVVNEKSKVNPLTEYAKSKIRAEKKLKELANKNFCVGILRNSTVYGFSPKFRDDLVVNNLVACALTTGEIRIMSDGTPWRPLIDVRDLANIFIEFLKVKQTKISGKIINIGFNKNNYQVRDIVEIIKKELPSCKVIFTGEHGKDSRSYKVNFNEFRKLFPKMKQKWPLKKSIVNLILELKKRHYNLSDFKNHKYTRLISLKKLITKKKINKNLFWN
jgi:nucleoside-diphosphate-sugar epimerase